MFLDTLKNKISKNKTQSFISNFILDISLNIDLKKYLK